MSRLPISSLALAAALGLCPACHRAGGDAGTQQAAAPAAQAIVQPGAPGQASAVISKVPAFQDNNYTDADVKFMQGMIHHHNQALLMVAMIPTHTTTVQLAELGRKIEISQTGEIQAMKDWLTDRHQEVPMLIARWLRDDGPDGHGGNARHAHGRADEGAWGGARRDVRRALSHGHDSAPHKGALTMVADLRAAGGAKEPNIADFASRVDTDQRMEIVRMYGLLGRPVDK